MNIEELESCVRGDRVVDCNGVNWQRTDFGSDDEWENNIATIDELKQSGYRTSFATSEVLWNRFEPIERIQ